MVVRSWSRAVGLAAAFAAGLVVLGAVSPPTHASAATVAAVFGEPLIEPANTPSPAMLIAPDSGDAPTMLPIVIKDGARVVASPSDSDLFFTQFIDRKVVIIENHLPRKTRVPLVAAAKYVDRYTKSRFVFGSCPTNATAAFCIRVYQRSLPNPSWAALTDWPTNQARIVFTPAYYNRSSFNSRLRYIGAVHELGHAMGIWWHNPSRKSVMYYLATRASTSFLSADIAVLRRH
jgi:hypothetical protein